MSFLLSSPWLLVLFVSPSASGTDDATVPSFEARTTVVDLSHAARARRAAQAAAPAPTVDGPKTLADLDRFVGVERPRQTTPGKLPAGWVQRGDQVFPSGDVGDADPPIPQDAWEMIPGNKYPRKHTLYLNFLGGMLQGGGADNSAENKSTLARSGNYPAFVGTNQQALSIIQAVQQDVASYGIRVMGETRPSKIVPYTMSMMGGDWTDTNLEDPAGGVAPGADCGARGQRHVVYSFGNASASTTSQEAGHAWGLDHTTNCSSVMAYCGGGSKGFSTTCDAICEAACQGSGTIGCRVEHEKYCGEGSNQQNEDAELSFLFGDATPDTVPPTVQIDQPTEGQSFPEGSTIDIRAAIDDDYGGVGYKYTVDHDGTNVIDEVVYVKTDYLDDDNRFRVLLSNAPAGSYHLVVTAEDHADHVVSDEVSFVVEGAAETGGEETGGTDDSGTSTSSGTSSTTGTSTTGTTSTTGPSSTSTTGPSTTTSTSSGEEGSESSDGEGSGPGSASDTGMMVGDEKGCACSANSSGAGALGQLLGLLALVAPGLRRRRGDSTPPA